MARLTTPAIARQLGTLFDDGSLVGLSDCQLIERFNHRRDEAAFAALVARHGPMVLGVCRQLLVDRHLAEDAFQATFLVLARKAHSLCDPDRLATWLYGVALRTARKARARLARQRIHEQGDVMDALTESVEPTAPPADHASLDRDQAELLHGEIDRLPGIFRSPIVLCYFEGLTLDEAARGCRCPAGTLRSRLARAREKLRRALTRRGFALSPTSMAAAPSPRSASASVSLALCDSTARAALRFVAGPAVASTAATLAHEFLRTMTIHKLRTAITTLLFLTAFAAGGGYLARSLAIGDEPRPAPAAVKPDDADAKPAPGRMFVVGRVLDPEGKPVPNATVMAYAALKQPGRGDAYDQMFPSPIGQAHGDGSGRFRLDATRTTSAHHRLVGAVALAPGHGAGWVELDPDANQPVGEISLRPEQVIQGRLFDLTGRPVRGVMVEVQAMGRVVPGHLLGPMAVRQALEGPSFSWYHRNDFPAWPRPATTDAEGRFTVHGVGRGVRVFLSIDDPRFARSRAPVDTDNAAGPKSVTMALEPAKIIAGRITDAQTGQPVPHVRLVVWSFKDGVGIIEQHDADADGRFRVNPLSADRYRVTASSTSGQPYLNASSGIFAWPKGALEHRIDLALRRGTVIRGKVVEEGTGRPVAGARVSFAARRTADEATRDWNGDGETMPDGSFRLAVLPAPGYLVVLGPSGDYVYRVIDEGIVLDGQPGRRRVYAHAFVPCDPKAGGEGPEVTVPLRRGRTVKGRVIGPDDRPIPSVAMIGRVFLNPSPAAWLAWSYSPDRRVRDGRFEAHGLDPDAEVPIHFLEPKGELGATARLSGQSGSGGPVTVRLEPCGTARVRLVGPDGNPVVGYPGARVISLVVTPGGSLAAPDQRGQTTADESLLPRIDPAHYGNGPVSDAEGRIAFPDLIPGASYRLIDRSEPSKGYPVRKDFTVKPGEAVELGDIVIENPARLIK